MIEEFHPRESQVSNFQGIRIIAFFCDDQCQMNRNQMSWYWSPKSDHMIYHCSRWTASRAPSSRIITREYLPLIWNCITITADKNRGIMIIPNRRYHSGTRDNRTYAQFRSGYLPPPSLHIHMWLSTQSNWDSEVLLHFTRELFRTVK
jgi:hypothetical protein